MMDTWLDHPLPNEVVFGAKAKKESDSVARTRVLQSYPVDLS